MSDLFHIASTFRTAIEEAIRAGEIQEMATFPRGCCSFASDLLQRYLTEQYGVFTWYILIAGMERAIIIVRGKPYLQCCAIRLKIRRT